MDKVKLYLLFGLIVFVGLLSLPGCGGGGYNSYDDDYYYDEEETGSYTHGDLIIEYEDGWYSATANVFQDYDELYNGDDSIHYADYAYNVYGKPDVDERYPNTVYPYEDSELKAAWEQGYDDALDEIFWYHETYYWGNQSYSKSDF